MFDWNSPQDDIAVSGTLRSPLHTSTTSSADNITGNLDSSVDSDDDAVLIRRADIDVNSNMEKTDEFSGGENMKTGIALEVTNSLTEDYENEYKQEIKGNSRRKCSARDLTKGSQRSLSGKKKNEPVADSLTSIVDAGATKHFQSDSMDVFKSPTPSNGKRKRGQYSAPAKLKTPNLVSGVKTTVTPQVTGASMEQDNYTTPQMDDILQKLTINEVKKAPQKRRHSSDSVDQVERTRLASSGRWVTRSLMAQRSVSLGSEVMSSLDNEGCKNKIVVFQKQKEDMSAREEIEMPRGTRGLKKQKQKGIEVRDTNNNNFDVYDFNEKVVNCPFKIMSEIQGQKKQLEKQTKENSAEESVALKPSGDAGQNMDAAEELSALKEQIENRRNVGKRETKRRYQVTSSGEDVKKMKLDREEPKETQNFQEEKDSLSSGSQECTIGSNSSSTEFGSTPPSSLRSLTPVGILRSIPALKTTESTLEKVLQSLRSTTVGTPTWLYSDSNVSSPRLLSPALSGISELSSVSDANSQVSGQSSQSVKTGGEKTFRSDTDNKASQAVEQKDLCDMFQDVTPPECKIKGPYKTTRMLPSVAIQEDSQQFKQFLQDDTDEIFP